VSFVRGSCVVCHHISSFFIVCCAKKNLDFVLFFVFLFLLDLWDLWSFVVVVYCSNIDGICVVWVCSRMMTVSAPFFAFTFIFRFVCCYVSFFSFDCAFSKSLFCHWLISLRFIIWSKFNYFLIFLYNIENLVFLSYNCKRDFQKCVHSLMFYQGKLWFFYM